MPRRKQTNEQPESKGIEPVDTEPVDAQAVSTDEAVNTEAEASQETTAPLLQNLSLQDAITVPDGGLVFRTTSGRPLMALHPTPDGCALNFYTSGEPMPDVSIIASEAGGAVHFGFGGFTAAAAGANHVGGYFAASQPGYDQCAALTASSAGGLVTVTDPAGDNAKSLFPGSPVPGSQVPGSQAEPVDPVLVQLMTPRPGEVLH